MPLVLRFTRSNLLWEDFPGDISWINPGDFPADPITDLRTKSNSLSIWILSDDKVELNRCISAYAAGRNVVDKIDYILFDEALLKILNLKIDSNNKGDLKDKEINQLHRDIIELSMSSLITLTKTIIACCEPGRILKQDVGELIKRSIENGWIIKSSLNKDLIHELEGKYNLS